ncbi:MAG: ribonuclease D [Parvularculales bacterium]
MIKPITQTEELTTTCAKLAKADFITVDTEFLRESTYWPLMCLIQMAGPDDNVLVDPLAFDLDLTPFYNLMTDRSVTKVFHAARQDVETLYHDASIIPTPLSDTQIMAMVCGFGDSVSYRNLVRKLIGEQIDKSSRYTDWSHRPLSDKQLQYALSDVTHLRTLYEKLSQQVCKSNRANWINEELSLLNNPATYEIKPEDAWRRLKINTHSHHSLAIIIEVSAWREQQAQRDNVPRNRILKDNAIQDIAVQIPKTPQDLKSLRSIHSGFINGPYSTDLLEAVQRGLARDPAILPSPKNSNTHASSDNAPLLALLKVLLKHQCAHHEVAQKLVASTEDLEKIANEDAANVPALKGWRYKVFGSSAIALKEGNLSLGARGRTLELIPHTD